MLKELSDEYSGEYSVKVPEEVHYPSLLEYSEKHEHLKPAVKDLKLSSSGDFNRVNRFLERLNRVGIPTDVGHNNLFKAIRIQLHCPGTYTDEKMRHQIASYMIEIVDFLFPIMEPYLKRLNISFNTYVMAVFNGRIWADEYILGTIGKMFNVCISVVSPYLSDVWNVFHDGTKQPHIVLIANGMDFIDVKYRISHFSATRGAAKEWKCVGHDIELKEVGLYIGETDGRRTAVDLFNINENRNLLQGTKKAVSAINKLCEDVENICIDRDNVLDELKKLKVKVKSFRRYTSYFVQDDYDDGLTKSKTKETMPEAKKITEVGASNLRAIPKIKFTDSRKKDFGQELMEQALEILDDDSELMKIRSAAENYRKRREIEQHDERQIVESSQGLEEGEISDHTISQEQVCYRSKGTDIESGTDDDKLSNLRRNRKKKDNLEVVSGVRKQSRDPEELVHQKRCRVKMPMVGRPKPGDIAPSLPSLGDYEKYLQSSEEADKKQSKHVYESSRPVEAEAEEGGILFEPSKAEALEFVESLEDESDVQQLADILHDEGGSELQEAVTVITADELQKIKTEDIFALQVQSIVEVPFTDVSSKIQQPEVETSTQVNLKSQSEHKKKRNTTKLQIFGKIPIKEEPKESSDSDDIIITKVERGSPPKIKEEVDISSKQRRDVRIVSKTKTDKEFKRRLNIVADVHQPEVNPARASIFDHNYIPAHFVEVGTAPSTSTGITRKDETVRIKADDSNRELDVFIPPAAGGVTRSEMSMVYKTRCRMPGKQTVTVQQTVDPTIPVAPPVPADQQIDDRYYCHMCSKSFKDLNYFRRHIRRLCVNLKNPEMLKCRYCDKLYKHENRYLDHLSTHDGKLRRKCKLCGKRFAMETQLTRHKKFYCTQKRK